MSNLNLQRNRAVWVDIPVVDLERAAGFYRAVLAIGVTMDTSQGALFGVLEHHEGNGGCLVPGASEITSTGGILVYMNVDGRMQDALLEVVRHGGKVLQPAQAIGPHGVRAVILDSEGNRLALHATDAS